MFVTEYYTFVYFYYIIFNCCDYIIIHILDKTEINIIMFHSLRLIYLEYLDLS